MLTTFYYSLGQAGKAPFLEPVLIFTRHMTCVGIHFQSPFVATRLSREHGDAAEWPWTDLALSDRWSVLQIQCHRLCAWNMTDDANVLSTCML